MIKFSNPDWIKLYEYPYERFEQIPESVFNEINQNLDRRVSREPLVSVLIPAWNEEINVLRSIASLSNQETAIPFEIIVINNNSSDNTQKTIDRLHVRSCFEARQGSGPARQKGQENALGRYILMGDADSLYPAKWIDKMMASLQQPGVAAVYGKHSFISEPGFPRWKLSILETLGDGITEIRNIKRPYLNPTGASMGYIREYGLKIGFLMNKFRGEDGMMILELMSHGKIKLVRSYKAVIWISPRSLQRDGTFLQAVLKRIIHDIRRFSLYFHGRVKELPSKDPDPA